VVDRAEAARVAIDRHVVRRIGEHHRAAFIAHQCHEGCRSEGSAAHQAMAAEDPQIPDPADRPTGRHFGRQICRVVVGFGEVFEWRDPQVDLADLKTGDLDTKVEIKKREFLELICEQLVIPRGDFGEAVVGDPEGADLRRA